MLGSGLVAPASNRRVLSGATAILLCFTVLEGSVQTWVEELIGSGTAIWVSAVGYALFPSELVVLFVLPLGYLALALRSATSRILRDPLVGLIFCLVTLGLIHAIRGQAQYGTGLAFSQFKVSFFRFLLVPLFIWVGINIDLAALYRRLLWFGLVLSFVLIALALGRVNTGGVYGPSEVGSVTGGMLLVLCLLFGLADGLLSRKFGRVAAALVILVAIVIPLQKPVLATLAVSVVTLLFAMGWAKASTLGSAGALFSSLRPVLVIGLLVVVVMVATIAIGGDDATSYVGNRFLKWNAIEAVPDLSSGRFEMWKWSVEQFVLSPVLGSGLGLLFDSSQKALPVHNEYLSVLYQTGMVTFVIYLAVLVGSTRRLAAATRLAFRLNRRDASVGVTSLSWIVSLLVSNLFGHMTGVQSTSLVFFSLMGLTLGWASALLRNRVPRVAPRRTLLC